MDALLLKHVSKRDTKRLRRVQRDVNPLFKIAPWELPPDCDAPLVAPADFVFRGFWPSKIEGVTYETEMWVRIVPWKNAFLHMFCDGAKPQNGNWTFGPSEWATPFSPDRVDLDTLREMFGPDTVGADSKNVMRLIFFDGAPYGHPGPHLLEALPLKFSHLRMFPLAYDIARFCWDGGSPAQPESSQTTKDQLMAALKDENSELHFALHWLRLTPQQQKKQALHFEHEDLDFMETVMRAVLHSQPDVWEEAGALKLKWETRQWKDNPFFRDVQRNRLVYVLNHQHVRQHPIVPRLIRWKEAVWNYFRPTFDEHLFDLAECVRDESADISTMTVEVAPPIAHEQIEALLLLREWWNQNFPPELFDAHNSDNAILDGASE